MSLNATDLGLYEECFHWPVEPEDGPLSADDLDLRRQREVLQARLLLEGYAASL